MARARVRAGRTWGGTLPRKELHEAAQQLTANQAGLIAVGEPTIEQGLDQALTKASKVVKRTVQATTDEITSERQEAQGLTVPVFPRDAYHKSQYDQDARFTTMPGPPALAGGKET